KRRSRIRRDKGKNAATRREAKIRFAENRERGSMVTRLAVNCERHQRWFSSLNFAFVRDYSYALHTNIGRDSLCWPSFALGPRSDQHRTAASRLGRPHAH